MTTETFENTQRSSYSNTDLAINLAEQIQLTYQEAEQLATDARSLVSESVAKAVECGSLLLRQKEALLQRNDGKRGGWLDWLGQHCPMIHERTARNYMRIAQHARIDSVEGGADVQLGETGNTLPVQQRVDLFNVTTQREALKVIGLMQPKSRATHECKTTDQANSKSDPTAPTVEFNKGLDRFRLWFNTRCEDQPLEKWSEDMKRIVRNELRWFGKLYIRLGGKSDELLD